MLLSLTNKTTIFLHPEYIAAVKYTGIFKKRIVDKKIIPVKQEENELDCSKIIKVLTQLLQTPPWKGCTAAIILSGQLTRFRIAKWNADITHEEQKTLILHQLNEIYGDNEQKLHILLSENGYGKNNLAFSIDADLYKDLRNLEKKKLFKFNSIIPSFVFIINYWHKLVNRSAYLIIKDSTHIYFANTLNNSWEGIKTIAIKENWQQEVERVFSRDMLQLNNEATFKHVYFHEYNQPNPSSMKHLHKNIIALRQNAPAESDIHLMFSNYLL